MTTIRISGVCERDLDLLLLEEFVASPSFLEWFLGRLGRQGAAELMHVARSVTTTNGESDLELTVRQEELVLKILVENKLDATFQVQQPQRYCDRAAGYLRDGICHATTTVVLAPHEYFPNDDETFGFDCRVEYEEILRWFEDADLGSRAEYKRELLQAAIARGASGWQLVPDPTTTAFWLHYWALATSSAPQLEMPRPTDKPGISSFIRFQPAGFPAGLSLLHKVAYGHVDLQFSRKGEQVGKLRQQYGNRLEPNMRIERAGKSAVVRVSVSRIDMRAPFAESEPAVQEGIRVAAQLVSWFQSVNAA